MLFVILSSNTSFSCKYPNSIITFSRVIFTSSSLTPIRPFRSLMSTNRKMYWELTFCFLVFINLGPHYFYLIKFATELIINKKCIYRSCFSRQKPLCQMLFIILFSNTSFSCKYPNSIVTFSRVMFTSSSLTPIRPFRSLMSTNKKMYSI